MTKIAIFYKVLGIILFVTIFTLAYHFHLHGQYSDYLDTHLFTRGFKHDLENIKKDAGQKDIYATQFKQTQTDFNSQMVVFPSAQNFTTALDTVKKAAEKAHIQVQTITPATPTQKDFYNEVPVQLTILGTYQQILNFMQMTATWNGPLFIWKNWTLSHQFKPKTTVLDETQNNDLLKMDVNAIFFSLP
jgi:type IV pilus assembly protein PilO